ncbi:hypothetical protein Bca52824_031509 [Brassica carinata]|uniref:Uncharacterized protein n=1 Tax=Brassica carinata TaxID=52824 RepID=A0A8X7S871_BRACI|nr:hypothetical protein Bca52824_031509 [Brassica carinata]
MGLRLPSPDDSPEMLRLNIESRHGGFLGPQGRPTMASVIKSGRFFPYDAVKQLRVDMVVPSLSASESDLSGDFWLIIEAPSTILFLDAGEASGRRRRDLLFSSCSSPLSACSVVLSFDVSLLGGPHDDGSLLRLSLSVRRRGSCFRFRVLTTDSVTFWGVPHRSAVVVSFKPSAPHPCCSFSTVLLTVKVSTPEIYVSPTNPSAIPTASATPNTRSSLDIATALLSLGSRCSTAMFPWYIDIFIIICARFAFNPREKP